jgi:hypothetical protein
LSFLFQKLESPPVKLQPPAFVHEPSSREVKIATALSKEFVLQRRHCIEAISGLATRILRPALKWIRSSSEPEIDLRTGLS